MVRRPLWIVAGCHDGMIRLLIFITDFADGGVVLPVWLTLTAGLFLVGWRRGAVAWLLVMGGVMAAMVLMKGAIDGWAKIVLSCRMPAIIIVRSYA